MALLTSILRAVFLILGGLLLFIAGLELLAAILCWLERARNGSGLMFADAEILFGLAVVSSLLGGFLLIAARWLRRRS